MKQQRVRSFADAHWFPVDLDVPGRLFSFLDLDLDVLEQSSFLDNRIAAPLDRSMAVAADEICAASFGTSEQTGWLLHTSFCCSTLLARALHLPPCQVTLKEPLLLRRLGDARDSGRDIGMLVEPAVRLLARPWDAGGGVTIKPTHAALNIARDLVSVLPASRVLVLTSSLEDFLVSNLKKPAETQSKIPQLAERALRSGDYVKRLPAQALAPPDLCAAAALQWCAQREIVADLAIEFGSTRIRVLDSEQLLDGFVDYVLAASAWLHLPASSSELTSRARYVANRHAKATEATYDATTRAAHAMQVRTHFAQTIGRALGWAERFLLPAMRPQALKLPRDFILS